MDRLKAVQEYVNGILETLSPQARRDGYIHLYGVSQACTLLAIKRKEDEELAAAAGLLHDLYAYKTGDRADHAHKGAAFARGALDAVGVFNEKEKTKIIDAIYRHSDKAQTDTPFDEILKDADVLQHSLFEPKAPMAKCKEKRFKAMLQGKSIVSGLML